MPRLLSAPSPGSQGASLLSLAGQPHRGRRWLQDQHAAEAHGDQVATEPRDAAAPRAGGGRGRRWRWAGTGGLQAPPRAAPGCPGGVRTPRCLQPLPGGPHSSPSPRPPRSPAPVQAQGHRVDVPSAEALPRGGLVVRRARGSLGVCRCRRRRRATQTSCSCRRSWSRRPRRRGRYPGPLSPALSRASPLVPLVRGLGRAGSHRCRTPGPPRTTTRWNDHFLFGMGARVHHGLSPCDLEKDHEASKGQGVAMVTLGAGLTQSLKLGPGARLCHPRHARSGSEAEEATTEPQSPEGPAPGAAQAV